mgnify:CR=1 FL=1
MSLQVRPAMTLITKSLLCKKYVFVILSLSKDLYITQYGSFGRLKMTIQSENILLKQPHFLLVSKQFFSG